jgi:hypothetical protein
MKRRGPQFCGPLLFLCVTSDVCSYRVITEIFCVTSAQRVLGLRAQYDNFRARIVSSRINFAVEAQLLRFGHVALVKTAKIL